MPLTCEGPRVRYVGLAAIPCILSRVSEVMRSFRTLEALLRITLLGLCATQLTACIAAYPRDGVPTEHMATAEVNGYPGDIRVWGDSYASVPADRLVLFRNERIKAAKTDPSIKPRELNALTLSGGGSSGAFGAGILAGWAKAGTRPKFDIVTGISAGSLIAPFAFLGPAYDDQLKQGFATIKDANIYTKHSILGVLSSASFTSNAPLAKMLDEHITEDMLDQIARESGKGRRLFIGTTNLDADRAVIWDMGAIAASNRPDRLKLFKQVILASTSIPGIFPPVELEVTAAGKTYHGDHQPDGVRPNDPKKSRLGGVEHGLTQPVLAREPGGDDDRRLRALVAEFAHDGGNCLRRRYYDAEVGNTWQVGRLRIAASPSHLRIFRVDRPDLALEAAVDDVVEDHTPDRAVAHRCPEHGDRPRSERMFEISDRHPCVSCSWR